MKFLSFVFFCCLLFTLFKTLPLLQSTAFSNNGGVYKSVTNILHLPPGKYVVVRGVDNGVSTADGQNHELEYSVKELSTGRFRVIKENSTVHTLYQKGSVITVEMPGEFSVECKDLPSP